MAKQKNVRIFLQEAIKGLKPEEFSDVVRLFQTSYLHYSEAIDVDGTNDGGFDIKVFRNKREVKKCVQVTTQKKIEIKIKNDLKKVSEMISDYRYSNKFEFFCTIPISEEKIEEYKKFAIDEYDIELDIYEAKRLAQLNCKEIVDYVYSLHSDIILKPEYMNIDRATKTLYDLLANGKDSSDIKNSLIDSVIISIVFEKSPIDISELKTELEKRTGKVFSDILHSINSLKSDQRIIKDSNNPKLIRLSESENSNVKDIIANATRLEKGFCDSFAEILAKYEINYTESVLNELKELYKFHYFNDIDDGCRYEESAYIKIFESFKKYLVNLINNKDDVDLLIEDIKNLCSSNNYLNKTSASESFLSLYKSNQLEHYLSLKHKDVYLDTPTFVYLLCDYYGVEKNDWDNPFYRSMKSLIRLRDKYPNKISFYITQNYLGEVVGEIKKALQISKLENYPFFKDMGGTRNTLFNYYEYLKKESLFDETIDSFDDFVYSLGLDNTNPNDVKFFKETYGFLYDVAENLDINIVEWSQNERYGDFKFLYEKVLLAKGKNKSDTAIRNDVNQVLSSLEHDKNSDCYLITWDTTIHLLRDTILQEEGYKNYRYFNICNPAKLSNRIALENFNIDESALTNEIFAYADKRYDISNRVKSLLELIAPFIKENGTGSKKLIRKLGRIRKEQLYQVGIDVVNEKEDRSLPIEEIIMLLIPNKEKEEKDKNIIDKFSVFMSSEENTDYIIGLIHQISELKDYSSFDLTDYFNKIGSVIIPS